MKFLNTIFASLLVTLSGQVSAGIITFDFDFKDNAGTSIGTGFYSFDDIAPGTKASFSSLTNFSWGFEISPLGISLSSALGHVPSTDSLITEGIILDGLVGYRSLRFFDDVPFHTNILHADLSAPFPTGVQFKEPQPNLAEYYDGRLIATGTFTATEVSEPATLALFSLAFAGFGWSRRTA